MRVTRKPWFGPKRYLGWGWTPVSWEGWAAVGVFVTLFLPAVILMQGLEKLTAVVLLLGALLVVCLLTGEPLR
ncbi:MAG TPA: hypothetical protein VFP34_04780 [Microlunatus sp.]|nr:hypothetical protein [Microlunatus sp.]